MKFLKYFLLVLLLLIAGGSYVIHGVYHGEVYMNRVFGMTKDGNYLFIADLHRSQIFGSLYLNSYVLHTYMGGKTSREEYSFWALGNSVHDHKNLTKYRETVDFEIAKNTIEIDYTTTSNGTLEIDSDDILSYFVTKTDPEYFRYMSSGLGYMNINGVSQEANIILDTLISHDGSHSRLAEGTVIDGFMGGFWDENGNTSYFDKTEILSKAANDPYTPHAYLLSLTPELEAKKSYELEKHETTNELSVTSNSAPVFSAKKEDIILLGDQLTTDAYYFFRGVNGAGKPIYGFINFVQN